MAKYLLITLILISVVFQPLNAGINYSVTYPELTLTSIRFFNGPYTCPDENDRVFETYFYSDEAKYIWTQIDIDNKLYNVRDHTHNLILNYYKPDGTLLGNTNNDFTIKSSWATSWRTDARGYDSTGNWAAGTYKVSVMIDNKEAGYEYFTIYDRNNTVTSSSSSSYTSSTSNSISYGRDYSYVEGSMKLFETGNTVGDREYRKYDNHFPKSSTRYVAYEISLNNYLYGVKDVPVTFKAKYYKFDGSLFGEPVLNYTVSRDWETPYVYHSLGWPEPGNWQVGTYLIELYNGDKLIDSKLFTIYDDSILSPKKSIVSGNNFPAPEKVGKYSGTSALWEIVNSTDYSININYSGRITGSISVPPNETKSIYLPGGTYTINGYSGKTSVLPYSGSVTMESGWKYQNKFFIKK